MERCGRMMTSFLSKLLPVCIVLSGWLYWSCEHKNDAPKAAQPARKVAQIAITDSLGQSVVQIIAEVAETEYQRSQGLMQRQHLAPHEGMLFVFQDESPRSFWMKNTLIPLDLLFVNGDNKVVHVAENAKPLSTRPISSRLPARYVLEVAGGYCREYGIIPGCRLEIDLSGQ